MATAKLKRKPRLSKIESYIAANSNSKEVHRERSGLTTTCGCLFGFVYKKKPTCLERFISAVISGEMWIVRYKALRAQLQKIHHEKKFGNW